MKKQRGHKKQDSMRQNIDIAFKLLKVILGGKSRSSKSVLQPRIAREKTIGIELMVTSRNFKFEIMRPTNIVLQLNS